jgi:hypothetical protein
MVTRLKAEFTKAVAPPLSQARIRSLSLTDALIAVEWLNAARGTKGRTHVLGIRTDLEYLGKMADTGRASTPEFRQRCNALNELLSHYTFRPVLYYDAGVWRYNAVPRKGRGRAVEVTHQGVTVQVNEATVVAALARLAANGELSKVRLCEWCKQNYRVSERDIDRFCSRGCQNAHYQARPEFKDRRKKIQKDYRVNKKREDAKALARARAL